MGLTDKFNRDESATHLELLRPLLDLQPHQALLVFAKDYLGLSYGRIGKILGRRKQALHKDYRRAIEEIRGERKVLRKKPYHTCWCDVGNHEFLSRDGSDRCCPKHKRGDDAEG